MIVEMAGRPVSHLKTSIEKHIEILREIKDIQVHSITISEPREIELAKEAQKQEPMFTTFAEAEFECENFSRLTETMFDFMPSSVEVIEPSKITIETNEATNLLNNISGRLHRYDEIAKILSEKYRQMEAALKMTQGALAQRDAKIKSMEGSEKNKIEKKSVKKKTVEKKTSNKK